MSANTPNDMPVSEALSAEAAQAHNTLTAWVQQIATERSELEDQRQNLDQRYVRHHGEILRSRARSIRTSPQQQALCVKG